MCNQRLFRYIVAIVAGLLISTSVSAASNWEQVSPNTPEELRGMWGAAADDIFAVGTNRAIVHYDGQQWTPMDSPPEAAEFRLYFDVSGTAGNDVYAVGQAGAVVHYDGIAWYFVAKTPCDLDVAPCPTDNDIRGVWVADANVVFVTALNDGIFRFDGNVWKSMGNPSGYIMAGIWGSGISDVFAVAGGGNVNHYDGHGWVNWQVAPSTVHFRDVWGSSANDVFAVGILGAIYHYDGSAWEAVSSPTSENLRGVWGTSATDVFAVGSNGTILHFDGMAWTTMSSGTTEEIWEVWGASYSEVWACGDHGTMVRLQRESVPVDEKTWGRLKDIYRSP